MCCVWHTFECEASRVPRKLLLCSFFFFVVLQAKKTSNEKWLNRKVWWNKIWIMNEYVHELRPTSAFSPNTHPHNFVAGKLFRVTCIFRIYIPRDSPTTRQNTWNKMRNCLFIPWSRAFEGTRSRGKCSATRWMRDRRWNWIFRFFRRGQDGKSILDICA